MPTYLVGDSIGASISLDDSIDIFLASKDLYTDTIALSDSVSIVVENTELTWAIAVQDTLGLSDGLLTFLTYKFTAGDSLSVSDQLDLSQFRVIVVSDSYSLSDSIFSNSNLGESLSFSDAVAYNLVTLAPVDHPILVSDSIQFFDSIALALLIGGIAVGDQFILHDKVSNSMPVSLLNYLRRYLNDVR